MVCLKYGVRQTFAAAGCLASYFVEVLNSSLLRILGVNTVKLKELLFQSSNPWSQTGNICLPC